MHMHSAVFTPIMYSAGELICQWAAKDIDQSDDQVLITDFIINTFHAKSHNSCSVIHLFAQSLTPPLSDQAW